MCSGRAVPSATRALGFAVVACNLLIGCATPAIVLFPRYASVTESLTSATMCPDQTHGSQAATERRSIPLHADHLFSKSIQWRERNIAKRKHAVQTKCELSQPAIGQL